MTQQTLPESGLKINDIGDSAWNNSHTDNLNLLNNTLLKFSNLLDVNASGITDMQAVEYNSSSGEFEPLDIPPGYSILTTTTTTSTTTTTV